MIERNLTYGGRLERLFANLIDTVILIFPSGFLAILLRDEGLITVATFALSLAYYTHFTASGWQATIGKRILGLYVVRADGQALTKRDAVERYLAYCLPSLPLYASFISTEVAPILVVWLSMFWFFPIVITPERVGMHDRLCRTRVLAGKVGT
ncbi:MAG: RDD family protein [Rickettsiales bacterium]